MKHVSAHEINFDEICESLWPQVYKFVYYKVQNTEEAEELTQDVFQKVYRQLKRQGISEDKIKPYIFMAARNIVYDLWRNKGRRPKTVDIGTLNEKGIEVQYDNKMMESNLIVEEALKNLPEEDRTIITLRILEGYSVNEVSQILGIPIGTVKSKQFRALQKLKEKLSKGGYFDE